MAGIGQILEAAQPYLRNPGVEAGGYLVWARSRASALSQTQIRRTSRIALTHALDNYAEVLENLPDDVRSLYPQELDRTDEPKWTLRSFYDPTGNRRLANNSPVLSYLFGVQKFGAIPHTWRSVPSFVEKDNSTNHEVLLQLLYDAAAYAKIVGVISRNPHAPVKNIIHASPRILIDDIAEHQDFDAVWQRDSSHIGGGWINLQRRAGQSRWVT